MSPTEAEWLEGTDYDSWYAEHRLPYEGPPDPEPPDEDEFAYCYECERPIEVASDHGANCPNRGYEDWADVGIIPGEPGVR